MSLLSQPRPAYVTDDAVGGAKVFPRDGRSGALHMRAPLTWSGVREYPLLRVNGRAARILRRPEEIKRPGYLKTCERITPTLGHPKNEAGESVLVDPDNYRIFAVGSVGDSIDIEDINGYPVPVGNITVNDRDAIASIEAGNDQVSQGFFALISPPPKNESKPDGEITIGIWKGPHGPEEYDYEHICDPEHPAAIEYAKSNPEFVREKIGANHIAVGIPQGRGLAQAQARPIEAFDDAGCIGAVTFLDASPPTSREETPVKIKISPPAFKIPKGLKKSDGTPFAIPCFDEAELMVEEKDSPELVTLLTRMAELFAMMAQEMSASQETAGEAEGAAEVAQGEAAAATETAEVAQVAATEAVAAVDALKIENAALIAEVEPLRKIEIDRVKAIAEKVAPGVGLDACESIEAIKVAAVKHADTEATDADVPGLWRSMVKGLDGAPDPKPETPGENFMTPTTGSDSAPLSRAAKLFGKKGNK